MLIDVSSLFGTVQPVEAVGALAREHGLIYVVDGAQAVGRIAVDFAWIGAHFVVTSGRKGLLGPQLGWDVVRARITTLGRALWGALAAIPGVALYGDAEHVGRTGICSFNCRDHDSREVCRALWARDRVIVSPGIHGSPLALRKIGVSGIVRASVHCYSSEEEIDRLARGVAALASDHARA